jgi:secondary thiamine-phosphate synthase enzyme
MEIYNIRTGKKEETIDVTQVVRNVIMKKNIKDGIALIFVPHTTAGIFINEGADPDVINDIESILEKTVPDSFSYRHSEGNSTAHVKSVLCGSSVTVPVENGNLKLGTWQSIFFAEFDGPRSRQIYVKIIADHLE